MQNSETDWETEIIYRGRQLSDYRASIIEECARLAESLSEQFFTTPATMQFNIAAAIRALKDKP